MFDTYGSLSIDSKVTQNANKISSSQYINNNNNNMNSNQCRNCLSTLTSSLSNIDVKNKDYKSSILHSASTSSIIGNSNQIPHQQLCIKCKELKRRDKILNGRLPTNIREDSKLHIPIENDSVNINFKPIITTDIHNEDNNNNNSKNTHLLITKKSVNIKSNISPSSKDYDTIPIEMRQNSFNCSSRSSSGDGSRRTNKIKSRIEDAKDEHHFLEDF